MALKHYDVCVVGLGVMGCHAALELQRRGMSVLGLDRYRPPHNRGSSHGHTRVIREAYFEHPLYVPFVQRAYELWHRLEDEAGKKLLTYTGGLMLGPADGELVTGALGSAEAHSLAYTKFNGAEVEAQFPGFRTPEGFTAIYEPRSGFIAAERSIEAALETALRNGCELHFNERVIDWQVTSRGVEVTTELHRFGANSLVLAAGPWLNELAPIQPSTWVARQPVMWVEPRARREVFEALPIFLWEQDRDLIFYGFPCDERGLKVARHHHGVTTTPKTIDRAFSLEDERPLRKWLSNAMPDANGPRVAGAVCMYTNTPDGNFLVDRLPSDDRIVIASACSGHGFKFAPAIGELVADLIDGSSPRFDIAPFRLGR